MKTTSTAILTILFTTQFLMGCSEQLSSQSGLIENSSSAAQTPIADPASGIESLDLKAQADDPSNLMGNNGLLALDFDKNTGDFIVILPMNQGVYVGSGSFPQYPDIKIVPLFDASGKMKVAIKIPAKYVIKGFEMGNASTLPSGEKLPAMPAGLNELPSISFNFPLENDIRLHLYVGLNALGVYVNFPKTTQVPVPFNISIPLKNKDKSRTLGYMTYVSSKNSYPAGIFISTVIPASVARVLEDHFKL